MTALLGSPPKTLVDRENGWSDVKWSRAAANAEGELCWTAREYYGGLFLDTEGMICWARQGWPVAACGTTMILTLTLG